MRAARPAVLLLWLLFFALLLVPTSVAVAQDVDPFFCRDFPDQCDRTGTVVESWLQVAAVLAAVAGTWSVAMRQIRREAGSLTGASSAGDPVAAALADRERNLARVTALARFTHPETERRAAVQGAVLGAVAAVILGAILGQRTGGEWALILGGFHLIVFAVVFATATFLVVEAPARAVRAIFGLGVAAGLILGWAVSWYIVEPIF